MLYDKTHKCDKLCSLCTATPPCAKDKSKYCGTWNRWFLSEKCFQNHIILKVKGKLFCQRRLVCRICSYLVTSDSKHECFKKFCTFCSKTQPSGHVCYVAPLKPSKLSNKYLYVFFDTECTQHLQKCDGSFEHVSNLICAQQICSKSENVDCVNVDCEQCGKRVHTFWQDPVGKFIDYLGHSLTRFMSFRTTLVDTTHSFFSEDYWNLDGSRNWKWTVVKFLVWLWKIFTFWIRWNICLWV